MDELPPFDEAVARLKAGLHTCGHPEVDTVKWVFREDVYFRAPRITYEDFLAQREIRWPPAMINAHNVDTNEDVIRFAYDYRRECGRGARLDAHYKSGNVAYCVAFMPANEEDCASLLVLRRGLSNAVATPLPLAIPCSPSRIAWQRRFDP